MNKTKTILLFSIIFLVSLILRVWNFPGIPYGYHQDELNAGYEAWSLLHYGTDRWGNSWPVYFSSWGSGQNVLYSYILIPFIAIFGDSEYTIRLAMVILGCLVPILIFFLTKLWSTKRVAFIAMGIAAIFPELVRGSRWAVESNMVPFLVALGLLVFSYALKGKKKWPILFSLLPLALTPYAYIITVVPVIITVIAVLIWKKQAVKLHWKWWTSALTIFIVTLTPLGLFGLKTTLFNNAPLFFEKWLPFSLPAMAESRYEQITQSEPIYTIFINNIIQLLSGSYKGQMGGGGDTINISIVVMIIAVLCCFFPKKQHFTQLNITHFWFLATIPLMIFVPLSNIRGNMLIPSAIIMVAVLIDALLKKYGNSIILKIGLSFAGIIFIAYSIFWYNQYLTTNAFFFYKDLNIAVQTVQKQNTEKIPVLFTTEKTYTDIPQYQMMWYLKPSPEELSKINPDNQIDNWIFQEKLRPTKEEYYEIIRKNYNLPACTNPTRTYEGYAWEVYKCAHP